MTAMKTLTTAVAMIALTLSADPARSGEDCDNVIRDTKEAIAIAVTNYQHSMEAVKAAPNQASAKNLFCAASGEFLGLSTAFRAIVPECFPDGSQRAALAELDKGIKEIQTLVDNTCK